MLKLFTRKELERTAYTGTTFSFIKVNLGQQVVAAAAAAAGGAAAAAVGMQWTCTCDVSMQVRDAYVGQSSSGTYDRN